MRTAQVQAGRVGRRTGAGSRADRRRGGEGRCIGAYTHRFAKGREGRGRRVDLKAHRLARGRRLGEQVQRLATAGMGLGEGAQAHRRIWA